MLYYFGISIVGGGLLLFGGGSILSLFWSMAQGLLRMPSVPALIVASILTIAIIVSCMCCILKEECNQKSEIDRQEDDSFHQQNTFIQLTPQIDARVIITFHIY